MWHYKDMKTRQATLKENMSHQPEPDKKVVVARSNVITRSMSNDAKYEFKNDFDDSSREWRKNKINIGNGSFTYR